MIDSVYNVSIALPKLEKGKRFIKISLSKMEKK